MKRYAALFRHPAVWPWSVLRALTRFPVAAGPLSFVLLTKTTTGDYATGAWMAASCTLCETIAAPILGSRLDRPGMLREVRYSLVTAGAAFLLIALLVREAPTPVMLGLAGLAGASTSGLQGGLRSLLLSQLHPQDAQAALGWESVIHQTVYATAPALATVLALGIDGRAPMVVTAAALLAATLITFRLTEREPTRTQHPHGPDGSLRGQVASSSPVRTLLRAWPIYATSAAVSYLAATVEVTMAPLLDHTGLSVSLAGPLLLGFALAALVGGLIYGARTWPFSYRSQSLLLMAVVSLVVPAIALVAPAGLPGIIPLLLLAGLLYAPVLTARNLSMREVLPPGLDSAGFSALYAASGLGFGVSAMATGVLLTHGSAPTVLLLAGAAALLLTGISALAEKRNQATRPTGKQDTAAASATQAATPGSPPPSATRNDPQGT
ncbi:MFS transporter [Streptomyces sp. NPDC057694]|uniref:MFS transporter n=1 Tax=Streptomyces sp. NPDC057694 TaxID=3346216 RepID=UPI0036CC8A10